MTSPENSEPPADPAGVEWHALGGTLPPPGTYGTVCVGGRDTAAAVAAFRGTATRVCTLVDHPLGIGKPTVRQIEAVAAVKDGCDAVEVPAHRPMLIRGDLDALRDDLLGITIAVREVSSAVEVRVVLQTVDLMRDPRRIEAVCNAVREAGVDGITIGATHGGPADVAGVQAARGAGETLLVKAWAEADAALAAGLLAAGADRVGMQGDNG